MFRLKLEYTQRISLLTPDEFHTLSERELVARAGKLRIPTFGPMRQISFCQGVSGTPDIQLMVQEFKPCNGDVLDKEWRGGDGRFTTTPLAPFCYYRP